MGSLGLSGYGFAVADSFDKGHIYSSFRFFYIADLCSWIVFINNFANLAVEDCCNFLFEDGSVPGSPTYKWL